MQKSFEQRIFTRVKNHLLKQNKRSSLNGSCMYRLEKNGKILKCAIGCLIQKKYYTADIEDHGISYISLSVNYASHEFVSTDNYSKLLQILLKSLQMKTFTSKQLIFLSDIQNIHDEHKPSVWKSNLRKLAKTYNLKY